jgi:hypothetical protein
MGIFDRFKKNKTSDNSDDLHGKKSNFNNDVNLSNPIIKKMVDWIEHPMEFGKKPDSIKIIDERMLFWPSQQKEQCYLCEYTVDGENYIGFTGPTTWTFFAVDLTKLTKEEIYLRYTGWFICFFTINAETYEKSKEGLNEEKVKADLMLAGLGELTCNQKAFIGGNTYYEFTAHEGLEKVKVVGTEGDMHKRPIDYILPFYEYIGIGWDPLN